MTDSAADIRADIAFMKGVVEDGGASSLRVGGAILFAAGLIYGAASGFVWLTAIGLVKLAAQSQVWAWVWSCAAALLCAAILVIVRLAPRHAKAPGDRAIAAAWSGAGLAICALGAAATGIMVTTHTAITWSLFPSVILAMYAAAWMVAAVVTYRAWMKALAAASLAAAAGLGFLVTTPHIFLAYGACMILLAAAPGYHLMRERAA